MTIEYKPLSELTEYENNPRDNEDAVDQVARSIELYGFKNPILIDSKGVIIAGHTRYKAAHKLGLSEVPTILVDDLTEDQVKAFRLADNKVSEKADWDMDLLRDELEGFPEGLPGFEEWELEHILNPFDEESLSDFYEEAEAKEKKAKMVQCPCCGEWFEE